MKKTASLFFLIICLTLVFSFTAFAESSSTSLTDSATTMGSHDTTSGMSSAYGNNNYGTNYTGTSSNNYRTNAATNTNNSNWGWLGLLGLAGLAGLRSRDRERT
jgi:MYXO-CTERM domain-containing protein